MIGTALIDDSGLYRYHLFRGWDSTKPIYAFIMLNPSTADAQKPDHTIRKCIGFTTRWGGGGFHVGNLFALRSRDPKALAKAADPIGPANDMYLKWLTETSSIIIAAWGNHKFAKTRALYVSELLRKSAPGRVFCLGTTGDGHPKHPLMPSYATELVAW